MIKTRIFFYELKRICLSKAYLLLLLLICVYSAYVLKTSVLRGFVDTAPFSEWSFMSYLFAVAPFLAAILLFFVSKLFSPYEKNVVRMTASTPFSGPMYFFIRLLAIAVAYAFAALIVVVLCFAFYGVVFDYFAYLTLALCAVLVLIPQLFFLMGLGLWVSRLNHNLAYVIIGLIFCVSFAGISFPYFLDALGNSIMSLPTNAIPINGVIAFELPIGFTLSRLMFCTFGALMIFAGCSKYRTLKRAS